MLEVQIMMLELPAARFPCAVVHLAGHRGAAGDAAGGRRRGYDGFLSPQVMLNLLIDNAFLLVIAVGMSFVILSGGIDLSVGSVLALTTMMAPGCCRLALAAAAGDRRRAGHGAAVRRGHGRDDPLLQAAGRSSSRWPACSWRAACAT
jgi:hypothetical protein